MDCVAMCRRRLDDLGRRAEAAVAQLGDEDVNWRPNDESNSIANLVLHMAGNVRQRLVAGLEGAPDVRDRDSEFNARAPMTRDDALAGLRDVFATSERVLAGMTPDRLDRPVRVRDRNVAALEVALTVTAHMGEHVGQILYVAKQRLGAAYRVVSLAHARA